MSRVGKKPIEIPENVDVKLTESRIEVKGPKGELNFSFSPLLNVEIKDGQIVVSVKSLSKQSKSLWGLTRMLIANMIKGVTEGYEKKLELNGVGYKMAVGSGQLNLSLGFSHPINVAIPKELNCVIEKNILTISGIDRQLVGQFAAKVRALKKIEPYKGKGFRYVGEVVRRKAGKKAVGVEK